MEGAVSPYILSYINSKIRELDLYFWADIMVKLSEDKSRMFGQGRNFNACRVRYYP